jgi:hypothetical protein
LPVEELVTKLTTLWKFDYEPKVKALRDLSEVAKREQWNAATDIDWNLEIDKEGDVLARPQDPTRELEAARALPEAKRKQLAVSNAAWILSQFVRRQCDDIPRYWQARR